MTGNCQPQPTVIATAYCLKGHTSSGPTTSQVHAVGGCIALSRPLAKDLGLKNGPGQYDYLFGVVIEVIGLGQFIFADLMPAKWTHYRVDIYYPSLKSCHAFGLRREQIRVVEGAYVQLEQISCKRSRQK